MIEYGYDPGGNRISKTVTKQNQPPVTTYYFRDATGNVMGVYEKTDVWTWKEQNLYGSSRLGVWNANIIMDGTIPSPYDATAIGSRHYELTNHLGNVLATVSDKKLLALPNNGCQPGTYPNILNIYNRGTETEYKARIEINFLPNDFASNNGDNFVAYTDPNLPECIPLPPAGSYFVAEVITANDYYPGGMNMPGRKYSAVTLSSGEGYRYGFNGKENDKDINEGNLDFGARIYDGRIGRWLSVDPHQQNYSALAPYQNCANNPITFKDIDGRDIYIYYYDKEKEVYVTAVRIITKDYNKELCTDATLGAMLMEKYGVPAGGPIQRRTSVYDLDKWIAGAKAISENFDNLSEVAGVRPPDAITIQIGGSAVALMGAVGGITAVLMLKGPDEFTVWEMEEWSVLENRGFDFGIGIEFGAAWHNPKLNEQPTITNFAEGDSHFVTFGAGAVAGSYQYSNMAGNGKPQDPSAWRWQSVGFSGELLGIPKVEFGLSIGTMKNSDPLPIIGPCPKPIYKTMQEVIVKAPEKKKVEQGKKLSNDSSSN